MDAALHLRVNGRVIRLDGSEIEPRENASASTGLHWELQKSELAIDLIAHRWMTWRVHATVHRKARCHASENATASLQATVRD